MLTDEQCAEIAKESRRIAAFGPTARVLAVVDHPRGEPSWMGDECLVLHPEDFCCLREVGRQAAAAYSTIDTRSAMTVKASTVKTAGHARSHHGPGSRSGSWSENQPLVMSEAEQELGAVHDEVHGVQQWPGHEVAEERDRVEQLEHDGPLLGATDCSPFGERVDWAELVSAPVAGLGLVLVCFGAALAWALPVIAGLVMLCWVAWRA